MTAPTPARLLRINVLSVVPQAIWPDDASAYANRPYCWTVVLHVTPQLHSSPLTRAPYVYNGEDIVVGDWMSNSLGGLAWQIKSISTHTSEQVTCVVEDVDQFNTYADPTSSADGAPSALINGFVFVETAYGYPILTPMVANVLIAQWEIEILSRFLKDGISSGPGISVLGAEVVPGTAPSGVHGDSGVAPLSISA